jgi:hypothetical protein
MIRAYNIASLIDIAASILFGCWAVYLLWRTKR